MWRIALPESRLDPASESSAESGDASAERPRSATRISPADSPEANYAFDVTPARLVTALTARGLRTASREGLLELFPERGRRVAAE